MVPPPVDDVTGAVVAWLAGAGAAPSPVALRAWLRERVPEYQAQPVRF